MPLSDLKRHFLPTFFSTESVNVTRKLKGMMRTVLLDSNADAWFRLNTFNVVV